MSGRPLCSDEVFVVAWQKAENLADAAATTGYPPDQKGKNACRMRATYLREQGVNLKHLGRAKSTWKLNYLAMRALEEA